MKITLINPYVPNDTFGTATPWEVPQLGIGYIAAVLEQNGYHVKIIDAYILKIQIPHLLSIIKSEKPDIIGITSNIYTAKYACYTAYKLKRDFPPIPIIMGGAYPTVAFQLLLENHFADFVVIGEGEKTIINLLEEFQKTKPAYRNVLGIAFIDHGAIIKTPGRPFIEDLDSLPFPAWHLFPPLKHYSNLRGVTKKPYLPIMTSRGCPYECIWCTKYVHGRKSRTRSSESILAEIKYFVNKFGVKEFAIMDDNFTVSPKRVKEVCVLLLKEKIQVSINLYNGIRADAISGDILKFLQAAGLNRVTVGVEAGNDCMLKSIKKHLTLAQARTAVKVIKSHHLLCDAYFILGLPEDTPRTMLQTIEFAKELDPTHAYFFIMTPFLGTELYDIVQRTATVIKPYKFGIPFHIVEGEAVYATKNFTLERVEAIFRHAYKSFYLRPKKVLELIRDYAILFINKRTMQEFKWLFSQALLFFRIFRQDKQKLKTEPK